MRDIKFRVLDKSIGRFRKIYAFEFKQGKIFSVEVDNSTTLLGKSFILMQSTGQKDKNGKEIFEGDIVKGSASSGVIEWDKDQWVVNPVPVDRGSLRLSEDNYDSDLQVIGNIYENPELLK